MNLAFCLFKYFPYGGLQRDFLKIARTCLARNHSVSVFTMDWQGEKDPQLPVKILPKKGLQNHTQIKSFTRQFQKEKQQFDLTIGFNKMPGLDVYFAADTCLKAKLASQKKYLTQYLPRYQDLLKNEAAVFSKNTNTKILTLCKQQKIDFIKHYETESERFYLLPPGISEDRKTPPNHAELRAQIRNKGNIAIDEFLLLFIGSGFKTKGLDRVLRGLAALPANLKNKTKLWIIGQDNEKPFKKLAKQLNINSQVNFLGGRDDVPNLLLAGDVLVHPAYNENTGAVLLEALVAGLPVLTTDVCGYADYILKAQAGKVLRSPFLQQNFNDTLQTMLAEVRHSNWQENGRTFAKNPEIYSMATTVVNLLESFKTCL